MQPITEPSSPGIPAGFWKRLKSGIQHAFAIEPEFVEITPEQESIVQRISAEVNKRGLATPTLLLLDMSVPLANLSAQLMHFFQPVLTVLANPGEYDAFTKFLERPDAVQILSSTIEKHNRNQD